jgi:glutamine synthetase
LGTRIGFWIEDIVRGEILDMDGNDVFKLIKDRGIESVALQFVDSLGKLYSLWVPPSELEAGAEDGIGMSGWPYFADVEKSDVLIKPDLNSLRVLPWSREGRNVAGVMCDIYHPDTREEVEEGPRYLLKRAIRELKSTIGDDVNLYAAPEIEFFLLKKNEKGELEVQDDGSYFSSPPADKGYELREDMCRALNQMGIKVVKTHHEAPPGKHEINIEYDKALNMADKVQFVKLVVRKLAHDRGLIATFMPKPFSHNWGAGHHTHISLLNEETGENLLYSSEGEHGLTDLGLYFISGILGHAKALACITNPTVNSYKRMLPESQAPMYISWSRFNRSVLLRIPASTPGATRVEYRPSDGSCNVYLSFAALTYAGLDGITKKELPPRPRDENVYALTKEERINRGIEELPKSLGEALEELEKDEVIKGALGLLFQKFYRLKSAEWMEYSYNVYDWERRRYLDDRETMEYLKPVWQMGKRT